MHSVKEAPTADKDSQEKPRPPKGRRKKGGRGHLAGTITSINNNNQHLANVNSNNTKKQPTDTDPNGRPISLSTRTSPLCFVNISKIPAAKAVHAKK